MAATRTAWRKMRSTQQDVGEITTERWDTSHPGSTRHLSPHRFVPGLFGVVFPTARSSRGWSVRTYRGWIAKPPNDPAPAAPAASGVTGRKPYAAGVLSRWFGEPPPQRLELTHRPPAPPARAPGPDLIILLRLRGPAELPPRQNHRSGSTEPCRLRNVLALQPDQRGHQLPRRGHPVGRGAVVPLVPDVLLGLAALGVLRGAVRGPVPGVPVERDDSVLNSLPEL